jgi:hypothetical protein
MQTLEFKDVAWKIIRVQIEISLGYSLQRVAFSRRRGDAASRGVEMSGTWRMQHARGLANNERFHGSAN